MVLFRLVCIGHGEITYGVIECIVSAQVAGDARRITGPGVDTSEVSDTNTDIGKVSIVVKGFY